MATPPTWAGLGFDGPVFLRKVTRKLWHGDPTAPLAQRTAEVAEAIFLSDPSDGYSVFLVDGDAALQRVTTAYNSRRGGLSYDLVWLPILESEVIAAGMNPVRSAGDTPCHFANGRHYDLPTDAVAIGRLCQTLIASEREALSLKGKQVKPWADQAVTDGCMATKVSTACRADGCLPPAE